jgi:hypothetical protein
MTRGLMRILRARGDGVPGYWRDVPPHSRAQRTRPYLYVRTSIPYGIGPDPATQAALAARRQST